MGGNSIVGTVDISLQLTEGNMKSGTITCPYCDTKFPHNGKEELQVCPGCGSKLIT